MPGLPPNYLPMYIFIFIELKLHVKSDIACMCMHWHKFVMIDNTSKCMYSGILYFVWFCHLCGGPQSDCNKNDIVTSSTVV